MNLNYYFLNNYRGMDYLNLEIVEEKSGVKRNEKLKDLENKKAGRSAGFYLYFCFFTNKK